MTAVIINIITFFQLYQWMLYQVYTKWYPSILKKKNLENRWRTISSYNYKIIERSLQSVIDFFKCISIEEHHSERLIHKGDTQFTNIIIK